MGPQFIIIQCLEVQQIKLSGIQAYKNMAWLWKITIVIQIFLLRAYADSECDYCVKSVMSCTICFSNCTTFVFTSCNDESGSLNQAECIRTCCSERTGRQTFNNDFMISCTQKSSQKDLFQSIGYYAILCGGSVAMLLLLIVIVRAVYQKIKQRPSRLNRRVIPSNTISFEASNLAGQQPSMQQIQERQYPQNYKQIVEDESNTCCICLDGDINALTRCGHVFHINCLASWGSRKNSCPLCNFKDIHEARYFCGKCKKQKGVLDFRRINLLQVERVSRQSCDNCGK